MRVRYSKRALADLIIVARYSRASFGDTVAFAVETRIRNVIARLERLPKAGRRLIDRPTVRVVPLIRYPYKIFYQVNAEQNELQILHIRHTSRRPWAGEQG